MFFSALTEIVLYFRTLLFFIHKITFKCTAFYIFMLIHSISTDAENRWQLENVILVGAFWWWMSLTTFAKKIIFKWRKERRCSCMWISSQLSPERAKSKESTYHLTHLTKSLIICKSGSQVSSSSVIRSFMRLYFSFSLLSHTRCALSLPYLGSLYICTSAQDVVVASKQTECVRRRTAACFRNTHQLLM